MANAASKCSTTGTKGLPPFLRDPLIDPFNNNNTTLNYHRTYERTVESTINELCLYYITPTNCIIIILYILCRHDIILLPTAGVRNNNNNNNVRFHPAGTPPRSINEVQQILLFVGDFCHCTFLHAIQLH